MSTDHSKPNAVDLYFMDARAKLIDIAAFMDRVDRADSLVPTILEMAQALRLTAVAEGVETAEQLAAAGHQIYKRKIELEHPLKELGHHNVTIRLPHDVHAEIKVNIAAEG